MTNERDDLIVLVDEEGKENSYELLDVIEMNNNEYVVLLEYKEDMEEAGDDADDEAEEVLIFKIVHGEDGEDSFVSIDNEDEMDAVFEEFKRRMEDEYDFDE